MDGFNAVRHHGGHAFHVDIPNGQAGALGWGTAGRIGEALHFHADSGDAVIRNAGQALELAEARNLVKEHAVLRIAGTRAAPAGGDVRRLNGVVPEVAVVRRESSIAAFFDDCGSTRTVSDVIVINS